MILPPPLPLCCLVHAQSHGDMYVTAFCCYEHLRSHIAPYVCSNIPPPHLAYSMHTNSWNVVAQIPITPIVSIPESNTQTCQIVEHISQPFDNTRSVENVTSELQTPQIMQSRNQLSDEVSEPAKPSENLQTVKQELSKPSEDLQTVKQELSKPSEDSQTVSEPTKPFEDLQTVKQELSKPSEDLQTVSELTTPSQDSQTVSEPTKPFEDLQTVKEPSAHLKPFSLSKKVEHAKTFAQILRNKEENNKNVSKEWQTPKHVAKPCVLSTPSSSSIMLYESSKSSKSELKNAIQKKTKSKKKKNGNVKTANKTANEEKAEMEFLDAECARVQSEKDDWSHTTVCRRYVDRRILLHRARCVISGDSRDEVLATLVSDTDTIYWQSLRRLYDNDDDEIRNVLARTVDYWFGLSPKDSYQLTHATWLTELGYARTAIEQDLPLYDIFLELNSPNLFCLTALLYKWMPQEHEQSVRQLLARLVKPKVMCVHCFKVTETRYTCKDCSDTTYCDETCQKANWRLHQRCCRNRLTFVHLTTEDGKKFKVTEHNVGNNNKSVKISEKILNVVKADKNVDNVFSQ